eukprot:CAMPEP_0185857140 /NCGR_PEP_ID=MMETSP1354-20130828/29358_1 /TAXON_ID=708628 /ORGANISM="Erythrolobus madagascarensis, Strain CCMP3276" /LENGTH=277 /DNA_ID=CAMNT_0028559407 /DNA_START=901 /DNA_END=1731 /DNA_ORIENTATION=-
MHTDAGMVRSQTWSQCQSDAGAKEWTEKEEACGDAERKSSNLPEWLSEKLEDATEIQLYDVDACEKRKQEKNGHYKKSAMYPRHLTWSCEERKDGLCFDEHVKPGEMFSGLTFESSEEDNDDDKGLETGVAKSASRHQSREVNFQEEKNLISVIRATLDDEEPGASGAFSMSSEEETDDDEKEEEMVVFENPALVLRLDEFERVLSRIESAPISARSISQPSTARVESNRIQNRQEHSNGNTQQLFIDLNALQSSPAHDPADRTKKTSWSSWMSPRW